MLTQQQLDAWVREHGPYLWHSVPAQFGKQYLAETLESIMANGLLPPAKTGVVAHQPARAGCVYLAAERQFAYGLPLIAVDVRKIAPERFVTDEDAYLHQWLAGREEAANDPEKRTALQVLSRETLATDPGADAPERVLGALQQFGSVAVEGGIGPDALTWDVQEWLRWVEAWNALPGRLSAESHPRLWLLFPQLALYASGLGSDVHGEPHLRAVAGEALRLAEVTEGADRAVAVSFGLLHDLMRRDDADDVGHGERAADLASAMYSDGLLPLSAEQFATLREALAGHAYGAVTANPTIGCCWDADRLQLPRVGIWPDPALLSTEAGRASIRMPAPEERTWDALIAASGLFPEREPMIVAVPASLLGRCLAEQEQAVPLEKASRAYARLRALRPRRRASRAAVAV